MALTLAAERHKELDRLSQALDSLSDTAFEHFKALRAARDQGITEVTREDFIKLYDVAVVGLMNAKRMLGKIQENILRDNPGRTYETRAGINYVLINR